MSFYDENRYIEELGIWVSIPLTTYDKKKITRTRNKQIKLNVATAAKTIASVPVVAESIVYMMTESGEMVVKH